MRKATKKVMNSRKMSGRVRTRELDDMSPEQLLAHALRLLSKRRQRWAEKPKTKRRGWQHTL